MLQTHNVLLKGSAGEGRGSGMVAKVSDFGMSIQMDRHQTHIDGMKNGTLTHMALGAEGTLCTGAS